MPEIGTLRSVGAGGGSLPLATRCEGSNVLAYSETRGVSLCFGQRIIYTPIKENILDVIDVASDPSEAAVVAPACGAGSITLVCHAVE